MSETTQDNQPGDAPAADATSDQTAPAPAAAPDPGAAATPAPDPAAAPADDAPPSSAEDRLAALEDKMERLLVKLESIIGVFC